MNRTTEFVKEWAPIIGVALLFDAFFYGLFLIGGLR